MKRDSLRQVRIWQVFGGVVVLLLVGGVIASTSTVYKEEQSKHLAGMPTKADESISTEAVHKQVDGSRETSVPGELDGGARQDAVKPTPVRQLLSREELLDANWQIPWDDFVSPSTWHRYGDYEIRYGQPLRGYTKDIVVRRADSSQEVVAEYTTKRFTSLVSPEEGYGISVVDLLINKKTDQLYTLVHYGGGEFRVPGGDIIQSDIFGNDPKYLGKDAGWDTGIAQDWRFSPDETTLSFVTAEQGWDLESEEGTGAITFHIIDLLDTERSVHFVLSNVDKHKRYAYREDDYWVRTWQFIDDEVVEYTVERDDLDNRMSGGRFKELWRYDTNTDESTLIETIPFFPP